MKLALALLLAACASDPPRLPADQAQLAPCNAQGWAASMTWHGRTITASDQCMAACNGGPFTESNYSSGACDAYDAMYGNVHCDSPTYFAGGYWGCCVTTPAGASPGPVNFAICDTQAPKPAG